MHVERRNCAGLGGWRPTCLQNNPTIDLFIFFISAFLKLMPFSKHFIQLNMCKINIRLLLTKHLVNECFVGTHVVTVEESS